MTLVKTAPLIHPGRKLGSLGKQLKHCARGLAFAPYTNAWFNTLQQPELSVAAENHPYLFQKLQRPYLNRTLNTRQRLAALQEHYHFVTSHLTPATRQEIYATTGKLLARLPLAEVGEFALYLSCSRQEKEGDLVLGLRNQQTGMLMFTLAFSITQYTTEAREIFIGGLQGNKWANDKEEIIAITRGLHGLRPKALLLFALQSLAEVWDITRLRATSDAMHIYQHWQKRKEVASSYDEWWLESGGLLGADGMFDLPVYFVPRDLALIKANKRSLYRHRYQMQAELAEQIAQSGK